MKKKLQLRKESLRSLSTQEMTEAAGGTRIETLRSVCVRCWVIQIPTYQTSPVVGPIGG